jgi:ribosomal protein S8
VTILGDLLSDAENAAAYEKDNITARNAKLKCELDEMLSRMRWIEGRTIEENLRKWK